MIQNGAGWIWFSGILLPAGFKDLKYYNNYYFRSLEQHLDEFKDQPIKYDFHTIIGKIKCVYKDNEGQLIVCGYVNKYYAKHNKGIAISFTSCDHVYSNFGCSIVKEPYYKECFILKEMSLINIIPLFPL